MATGVLAGAAHGGRFGQNERTGFLVRIRGQTRTSGGFEDRFGRGAERPQSAGVFRRLVGSPDVVAGGRNDAQDGVPMGADEGQVDTPGDHGFQCRIYRWLAEAVEPAVLKVGCNTNRLKF